jgi:hypothetical protein
MKKHSYVLSFILSPLSLYMRLGGLTLRSGLGTALQMSWPSHESRPHYSCSGLSHMDVFPMSKFRSLVQNVQVVQAVQAPTCFLPRDSRGRIKEGVKRLKHGTVGMVKLVNAEIYWPQTGETCSSDFVR